MPTLSQSTKSQSETDIQRNWHLVDLKGKVLGRVAGSISKLLQGKHKTAYTQYLDSGDHVVAINAKDIILTGRKLLQKTYTNYSGYPGGLRVRTAAEVIAKNPKEIVQHAVSGMLPKNKLRQRRLTRFFIFTGEEHPYKEKFGTKTK